MSKHTPGPWKVITGAIYSDSVYTDNKTPGRIALMDRNNKETSPTERDANACLIAVAPEMVKALQRLVDCFEAACGNQKSEYTANARALLARIEGEK